MEKRGTEAVDLKKSPKVSTNVRVRNVLTLARKTEMSDPDRKKGLSTDMPETVDPTAAVPWGAQVAVGGCVFMTVQGAHVCGLYSEVFAKWR